jgi:hypothetical protein
LECAALLKEIEVAKLGREKIVGEPKSMGVELAGG